MFHCCPLFTSQRRFPDFSYVTQNGRLTDFLDCVIIRFVAVAFRALHSFSVVQSITSGLFLDLFQSFPSGPLRRSALHERDGGLRRPHLHDSPHQGHLPHPAGRLPEDHRGQEGRNQLLHLTDDQRLHEESGSSEPPPNRAGELWLRCHGCRSCSSATELSLAAVAGRWMRSWRSRRITQVTSWEPPWSTSKWARSPWSTP